MRPSQRTLNACQSGRRLVHAAFLVALADDEGIVTPDPQSCITLMVAYLDIQKTASEALAYLEQEGKINHEPLRSN